MKLQRPGETLICIDPYYNNDLAIKLEQWKPYTFNGFTKHGGILIKEFPQAVSGFLPTRFESYVVGNALKLINNVTI